MMYVKLPKLMSINVGRATITDMVKIAVLKAQNPAVIDQAVTLYEKELAEDAEKVAKTKGDEKQALEKKLAEKQACCDKVKALKPAAKTKKAPK
jgi:hypothetical protein